MYVSSAYLNQYKQPLDFSIRLMQMAPPDTVETGDFSIKNLLWNLYTKMLKILGEIKTKSQFLVNLQEDGL